MRTAMTSPERPEPSRPLARQLAAEFADVADVEITRTGIGLFVRVVPHRAGARSLVWSDHGDEIILEVGEIGGRWELDAEAVTLAFLRDVVLSVLAGRVSEVFAYRRSRVTVTLSDGSVVSETGYDGLTACLPLPLWPRWARRVRYEPYR